MVNRIVLIDSAGLIPKRGAKYHIKVYSFKALRFIYKILFFWLKDVEKMERFYKSFSFRRYKDADRIKRKILVKVVDENLKPILKDIEESSLLI